MSLVTLNGRRVFSADVHLLAEGVSWFEATVDSSSPMTGQVLLNAPGLTFVGTVDSTSSGVFQDSLKVRVLAGGNGLGGTISPKFYRNAPLSVPLADLLTAAGETLSADADDTVTDRTLAKWTRPDGRIVDAVNALIVDQAGASWRIGTDGEFWCGTHAYATQDFAHQLLVHDTTARKFVIASERLVARPGRTFRGERISEVRFEIGPKAIRTHLRYGDNLARLFAKVVDELAPDAGALRFYAGTVATQHSDGTLDVKPDDVTRAPSSGWVRVPIRYGLPGVSATVAAGSRVLVSYENSDRSKPVATLWESDPARLTEIKLAGGSASVARVGDTGDCGSLAWTTIPNVITLSYVSPSGATTTLFAMTLAAAASMNVSPPSGSVDLSALITSGAAKVKA